MTHLNYSSAGSKDRYLRGRCSIQGVEPEDIRLQFDTMPSIAT